MEQRPEIQALVDEGRVALDTWLATPLEAAQVRDLRASIIAQRGRATGNERLQFGLRLAEMICDHWAGRDAEAVYQTLKVRARQPEAHALLELCRGQLLMAHRRQPAWEHLDHGFRLAARLLEADAYFDVLKRHDLLRYLPLTAAGAEAAASLETLLRDARVIAQFEDRSARVRPAGSGHRDTLD